MNFAGTTKTESVQGADGWKAEIKRISEQGHIKDYCTIRVGSNSTSYTVRIKFIYCLWHKSFAHGHHQILALNHKIQTICKLCRGSLLNLDFLDFISLQDYICYKAPLARASKFFEKAFTANFKEAKMGIDKPILLEKIDPSVFECAMR